MSGASHQVSTTNNQDWIAASVSKAMLNGALVVGAEMGLRKQDLKRATTIGVIGAVSTFAMDTYTMNKYNGRFGGVPFLFVENIAEILTPIITSVVTAGVAKVAVEEPFWYTFLIQLGAAEIANYTTHRITG